MANTYIYQMTDNWNNNSIDSVGIGMSVTDTASTSNSALLNLTYNGSNQFTVYKSGDTVLSGGISANSAYTNPVSDGITIDYVVGSGRIMVGQNDGLVVYAGNSTTVSNTTVLMSIGNSGIMSLGNMTANVQIGSNTILGTPSVVAGYGNSNSSVDIVITNANTGGNTSSDFAAYDNGGLSGSNFVDMGINGSTWSNSAWTINGPSDGYLYTGSTNLSIGTASAAYINFFTGGTLAANERVRITATGNVGIGNTAPNATLAVTGAANISGNVVVGTTLSIYGSSVIGQFLANSIQYSVGNSTVNTFSNSTHFFAGNSTSYGLGNSTVEALVTANSTANISVATLTSSTYQVGNATVYGFGNSTVEGIYNTTTNTSVVMTGSSIVVGNTTAGIVNTYTANITSNTFTLGSGGTASAQAANGWTYLPNGMKANYGWVSANSSVANVSFSSPFATACFHVWLTPVSSAATGPYLMQPANTTVAPIRTTSATAANVAYWAIGF